MNEYQYSELEAASYVARRLDESRVWLSDRGHNEKADHDTAEDSP